MPQQPTIPILLDTDIGSDIDDAVCLAYLLRQPRCELLGITTVTGEARKRAMLADAIGRAAGGKEIRIHAGAEQPFLISQQQPQAPQSEILRDFPHRDDFAPNTAVEFLRQTIRRRPGEITLLTIGPLTNIGLLFATDPEIPAMLKSLVLMSGIFLNGGPGAREWNTMGDPHASAIVYRAPVAPHLSIGLDVTLRCRMDAQECGRRLHGGPLDVVAKMAEVWFRGVEQITFHDPLAATVIFQPDLCRYQDGYIGIGPGQSREAPRHGAVQPPRRPETAPHCRGGGCRALLRALFQRSGCGVKTVIYITKTRRHANSQRFLFLRNSIAYSLCLRVFVLKIEPPLHERQTTAATAPHYPHVACLRAHRHKRHNRNIPAV